MPSPGDLRVLGIESTSLMSPALAGEFFTAKAPGKPKYLAPHPNLGFWQIKELLSVGFSYKTGYTEARSSGSDDIYGNSDDIITRYIFDRLGRVVSVYSRDNDGTVIYGAANYKYEDQENIKGKIRGSNSF